MPKFTQFAKLKYLFRCRRRIQDRGPGGFLPPGAAPTGRAGVPGLQTQGEGQGHLETLGAR